MTRRSSPLKIPGFQVLERLGGGGFGQVYRCVQTFPSHNPKSHQAIKVLSHPLSDKSVQREVSVWKLLSDAALRFPTIDSMPLVPMYGLHTTEEGHACISMRLCSGGTLADALQEGGPLSESKAMAVAHTLARALLMCHEIGVVHMDLKPSNVLFPCVETKASCRGALLADFGLSRLLPRDVDFTIVGRGTGTCGFQAPEVISDGVCSTAADAWSLGALLLQALTGRLPPSDDDDDDHGLISAFQRVIDPSWLCDEEVPLQSWLDDYMRDCPRWFSLSPAARDAIQGLLCPTIKQRLTPLQLINHPWLMDEQLAYRKYLEDTVLTTSITGSSSSRCNALAPVFPFANNAIATHSAFAAR